MLKKLSRKRKKELRLPELIAIALGGMVGGGIFAILGISVENIGNATPVAFLIGGILAFFAAYSYVKLALYYKDEGATYSFFKKTFPNSPFSSSAIGWLVSFGYISTLALYAFTFSTYLGSVLPFNDSYWSNKLIAGGIISVFAIINIVSVKGMGKIEDWMVYTKLILLLFISGLLAGKGHLENFTPIIESDTSTLSILIIASITFVAFEGFQLVIHAYDEMDEPQKNIPRAIYSSIIIATLVYVTLAIGALATIPKEIIIKDKEYALAAGAQEILGDLGMFIVIFGALLATSSAISGTLFGASRLMAVIAKDGYLPNKLSNRVKGHIPNYAIITMAILSFALILSGGLQLLLEFGSITFIIVSFLMAYANYVKRHETKTRLIPAIIAMVGLLIGGILIFYYVFTEDPKQLVYILFIYLILILGAIIYARKNKRTIT
ncbi:MAG: APC family permease [Crocinitomicaceae bacterium]|nr:APC family permease [Crocinitomicaceae bacterium]